MRKVDTTRAISSVRVGGSLSCSLGRGRRGDVKSHRSDRYDIRWEGEGGDRRGHTGRVRTFVDVLEVEGLR